MDRSRDEILAIEMAGINEDGEIDNTVAREQARDHYLKAWRAYNVEGDVAGCEAEYLTARQYLIDTNQPFPKDDAQLAKILEFEKKKSEQGE